MRQYPRDISDQVINDKISVGSNGKTVGVKEMMCRWDSDDVTVRKGKTVVAGGGGGGCVSRGESTICHGDAVRGAGFWLPCLDASGGEMVVENVC